MGRESSITYEQVAAVADALREANVQPTSRSVRERLGNTGSMGTIHRLLQEWKATQERHATLPPTLPPAVQRAILAYTATEVASATAQLETAMSEQRQEMGDLAAENERLNADIDERVATELALRADLAALQGRLAQTDGELSRARHEAARERDAAGKAHVALAKAQLQLEHLTRLEAELAALQADLKKEHSARNEAAQLAAVLEARLDAARERALQAEASSAEFREAMMGRDHARGDSTERRRVTGAPG
jgi:colicin import membrane protein